MTDARSSAHDAGMAQLLAFLGAMVGGGVQRSPAQVGLNWVMSKGATPEVATRRDARLGMRRRHAVAAGRKRRGDRGRARGGGGAGFRK